MKNITAQQLKEWLATGEAVLIDVREPAEYEAEHIAGAHLLPLGGVAADALPAHEGKKLVFQCRLGRRGAAACEKIEGLGAAGEVYNLEGGLNAWTQAGFPVETSGKFCLPLDRQVQLTVGVFVLASSVLGYTVDRGFLVVAMVFGAGLCFAAVSGFCGLAVLLAKMPWNKGGVEQKSGGSCMLR